MNNNFKLLEMVSDEPYKWRNCESLDIPENYLGSTQSLVTKQNNMTL